MTRTETTVEAGTDAGPSVRPASRAFPGAVLAMAFRSLGVLAVLAVPVVSGLGSVDGGAHGGAQVERPDSQRETTWKAAWSERYPGCVPSVLWPADEHPKALLTRGPDGRIYRFAVAPDDDLVRAVPAEARTVGVCR
jgi:hypothetical protein